MAFEKGLAKSEQAYEQFTDISSVFADIVKNDFFNTWQWWAGLALFIIPWLIWFKYRKKDSTGRLLLAGLAVIILSLTIDLAALSLGLWSYPMIIIPLAPFLFLPYHFSLAPIGIMLALQIKPEMNTLLKGIIFSAIAAFGGMNLFNAIDFYNPKDWSTLYDFVIFLNSILQRVLDNEDGEFSWSGKRNRKKIKDFPGYIRKSFFTIGLKSPATNDTVMNPSPCMQKNRPITTKRNVGAGLV